MALVVALIATALAYPIAYFLAFQAGRRAGFYLILLLVPFWTSYLLRVMAWKFMLGDDGRHQFLADRTGLIHEPIERAALQPHRRHPHPDLRLDTVRRAADPGRAAADRLRLLEAAADLCATPLPAVLARDISAQPARASSRRSSWSSSRPWANT